MSFQPYHIRNIKERELVYGDVICKDNKLEYQDILDALEEANILYYSEDYECAIDYKSLMDFNTNAVYPITSKSTQIINDLQDKASQSQYAKESGDYRIGCMVNTTNDVSIENNVS